MREILSRTHAQAARSTQLNDFWQFYALMMWRTVRFV
jgi:hypothetical protein